MISLVQELTLHPRETQEEREQVDEQERDRVGPLLTIVLWLPQGDLLSLNKTGLSGSKPQVVKDS